MSTMPLMNILNNNSALKREAWDLHPRGGANCCNDIYGVCVEYLCLNIGETAVDG